MTNGTPDRALLCIDYINEIVSPDGKLAGKGYAEFVKQHETLDKVAALMEKTRASGGVIVGVRLGFSSDYVEQPESSPLFGQAKKFGALQIGTQATEFHSALRFMPEDVILWKHRVSAFHGTSLDVILRNQGIKKLLIAGVATDLAVQSAARDAHDLDYSVTVVSDACAAANEEDHEQSLRMLAKIADIKSVNDV